MTHREFLTWQRWLEREWNRPSRSDYYQMQTAFEAWRVLRKSETIKIDDFKIPFGRDGQEEQERKKQLSEKESVERVKQGLAAALMSGVRKTVDWVTGKPRE